MTSGNFAARLGQANWASKNNTDNLVEQTDFGDKLKNQIKKLL